MIIFRCIKRMVCALFLVAFAAQLSHAAATITVEQSGAIQGNGLDGIHGIELNISYDPSLLASPTVTKGSFISGAMLAANTSSPGTIRIAIISTTPFSGSGQIATITFASNKGNGIRTVTASSIDKDGAPLSVQATVGASSQSLIQSSSQSESLQSSTQSESLPAPAPVTVQAMTTNPTTSTATRSTATTATTPVTQTTYPGTIVMPTEPQQPTDIKQIPPEVTTQQQSIPVEPIARNQVAQTVSAAKSTVGTNSNEPQQYVVYKSVLDRFQQYVGDKSLPILTALFSKYVSKNIRQEPAIALSDGKSPIRVIVDISTGIATSPNFALHGAKMVSVKKDAVQTGRWIIEALPDVNALKATLTILIGAEGFEYPLTVAPAVANSRKLDEAVWNMFLKEAGTSKASQNDLNQDGRWDYVDEFIFVANHLARKNDSGGATHNRSKTGGV